MHGSTKGEEVWIHLTDLRTLMSDSNSTPHRSVFAYYNGKSLDPKEYIDEDNSKINQYNYKSMLKYTY